MYIYIYIYIYIKITKNSEQTYWNSIRVEYEIKKSINDSI